LLHRVRREDTENHRELIKIILKNSVNILLVLVFGIAITSNISFAQSEEEISEDECTFNGIQLFGKIQFVDSFPDLTVQVVESFPDLKVKIVSSFPDDCGEWQIVDSFPDVKIKIVESFADIKIKFVESFPGIP
jgi:hypothetical protein